MENYSLVITEKPDAASRIAKAIDYSGKPIRKNENGVPYFIAKRDGKIVVVPSLGHLYTVTGKAKKKGQYPVYDVEWVPLFQINRKKKHVRLWLEVISKLAKGAKEFIDACDYDIEGSIIGYCILKYACGDKEKIAKRMKYSTLTDEDLRKSFLKQLNSLDFSLIEAGLARHEIDWLYGVNISKALTISTKKKSGYYSTLSTGRVQGPTLKFLVEKEKTIASFVPVPFWTLKVVLDIDGAQIEAFYKKRVENKKIAVNIAKQIEQNRGRVEKVNSKKHIQYPPFPFDLGSLQSEAYACFGYSPIKTLSLAQRLYLKALISYPRTSSQKLPPEIGYKKILKSLTKNAYFSKLAFELISKTNLKPTQGKKEDSAHPAIYPTGKLPPKNLLTSERNIWRLVVARFLAVFGEPAVRVSVRIIITINEIKLVAYGKRIAFDGWLHYYRDFSRFHEIILPNFHEGQCVDVSNTIIEDKFTKPPVRFNGRILLQKMEEESIGTKTTRAGIIQILQERGYIQDENFEATDLGLSVEKILELYCPSVISVELTRELEQKMDQIQAKNESRDKTIQEAIRLLKPVMDNLILNEAEIGEKLGSSLKNFKFNQMIIGPCPDCKSGNLSIIRSKNTLKQFVGCTNYFNGICKTAYPLPQKGLVKPSGRRCKDCGWFTVKVWRGKRRSWNLCFNPDCLSKKGAEKN